MTQVCFVTTNAGKATALRAVLSQAGYTVKQVSLPLIEPQADSVEMVAQSKAEQAFRQLRQPLVVEDSSFVVDELAGFPGPYTRYMLETIGVEGLLRLAEPLRSRSCAFVSALTYIGAGGHLTTFIDRSPGTLARVLDETPSADAWNDLWRVFIPDGASKPLSAFSAAEQAALRESWQERAVYVQFRRWLASGQGEA